MFFECFSQLIAFSISAVASSCFVAVGSAIFFAQKMSGEVQGDPNGCVTKTSSTNTFAKKGRLPTFGGPENWQTSLF